MTILGPRWIGGNMNPLSKEYYGNSLSIAVLGNAHHSLTKSLVVTSRFRSRFQYRLVVSIELRPSSLLIWVSGTPFS
jgi:hypothetical protein